MTWCLDWTGDRARPELRADRSLPDRDARVGRRAAARRDGANRGVDLRLARRPADRRRPLKRWSAGVLPWSERFFQRHGSKTVFIGRFFAVLRVTAAWMAGISRMPWWKFLAWNAAGGICWALLVGLLAYYFGHAAADVVNEYGLVGGAVLVGVAAIVLVALHFWKKRLMEAETEP